MLCQLLLTLCSLVIIYDVHTVFHKIGTPLFSFYNLSKCWSILIEIISLCSARIFLTGTRYNVFFTLLFIELQLTTRSGTRYKTKIKDVHELRARIVDEWDKLDQRIIDKVQRRVVKETSSLCDCRRRTVRT